MGRVMRAGDVGGGGLGAAWRGVCASALAGVVMAGAVGCDGSDPVETALRDARLDMVTVDGGEGGRESAYAGVVRELEGAIGRASGSPAVPAARLVIAEAEAGRGAIAGGEAEAARGEVLDLLTGARGVIEGLGVVRQSAREIGAFDADRERRRLRGERGEVEGDVADARGALDSSREAFSSARALVEASEASAREARLRENEARERALRLRGRERAGAIEEAVGHEREAQRHERRAEELGLGALTAERAVVDAARVLAGQERRLEALDSVLGAVDDAERDAAAYARETRELVSSYEGRLEELLGEVMEGYAGFAAAFDRADGLYEGAVTAAGRVSGRGVGEQASSVRSWALQARAGLALSRAMVARELAEVLRLAGRDGDAAGYEGEVGDYVEAAAGLLDEAASAMRATGDAGRRAQERMRGRASALREGGLDAVFGGEGAGTGEGGAG